jgi:hypothetical protein
LVENTSTLNPSPNISRTKSLIKPPPPRTSWELLLDDYLKDPNFKLNLTPKISQSHQQSTLPPSQPASPHPVQPAFVPSSNYQYPLYSSCVPCQRKSFLPPRRYEMNLDEIVYLISQVGRSDIYREMVQYIKTQQLSNISSSHSINKSSNINAYSTRKSPRIQDELTKKLNRLKLNKKSI